MCLSIVKNRVFPIIILFVLVQISCGNKTKDDSAEASGISDQNTFKLDDRITRDALPEIAANIRVGANRTEVYLPLLKGKRVGIIANQTSVIFKATANSNTAFESDHYIHVVDSLLKRNINIKKVFAPEHGFRGKVDAGELIKDGVDTKTGLRIVSLYGSNKKPSPEQLADLDVVVFDIQDVGARFYTYISTLHYVMEACAELDIPVIIFDRPNPNGHYIDGPILELKHQGFVGMHPIPVVHGMTIGEYAKMINGEGWLKNNIKCAVTIIEMEHYTHKTTYDLPIKPSPNLPNSQAINLYPSLCFFEGTTVNAGRGTSKQFQVYGSPFLDKTLYPYQYTPESNEGAKHPKHKGTLCFGEDLSSHDAMTGIDLSYVIRAYQNTSDKTNFFSDYFTTLAGTTALQLQIESGVSETEIKASWAEGLSKFRTVRQAYLIYE